MKDYYKELDLTFKDSSNPSKSGIKKAYVALVKKYHPDKNASFKFKEAFNEKLQNLNEAYDVLKDPIKKAAYDMEYIEFKKKYSHLNEKEIITKNTSSNNYSRCKKKPINWTIILLIIVLGFSAINGFMHFKRTQAANAKKTKLIETNIWEGYFKGYSDTYSVTFEVLSKNPRIIFKPSYREDKTEIYSYLLSEPYINKDNGHIRMDSIENPEGRKSLSVEFKVEEGRLIGDFIPPNKKYKEDRLFLEKSNLLVENNFTEDTVWKGSYIINGVERNLFLENQGDETIFSFTPKYKDEALPTGSFSMDNSKVDLKSSYIELTHQEWIDYPSSETEYIMVDLRGLINGARLQGNIFDGDDSIGTFTLEKTNIKTSPLLFKEGSRWEGTFSLNNKPYEMQLLPKKDHTILKYCSHKDLNKVTTLEMDNVILSKFTNRFILSSNKVIDGDEKIPDFYLEGVIKDSLITGKIYSKFLGVPLGEFTVTLCN